MKRVLLFFILFFSSLFTFSQNNDIQILQLTNEIVSRQVNGNSNKVNFLKADSCNLSSNYIKLYFNTNTTFTTKELDASIIESLPELLQEIATKFNKNSVMLYGKEAGSLQWKTLDYFANHPDKVNFVAEKNTDVSSEISQTKNNVTYYKVFPTSGNPLPTGPLSGKTVWLSPGHGWQNTGTGLGFLTQRGTTNEIVEDFTTAESIDYYLLNYLLNAGANVWSVRERDYNSNEYIVNNDVLSSGYAETGTWTTGSAAGYGGTYRYAISNATETATAEFTPNVTTSGLYWVSLRFIAGSNRATDAKYTIIHSADTTVVKVNQEIHSNTWIYVGQFYFTAGSTNKIILSNQSAEASQAIIADAVRLGGGIGTEADCVYTTQGASGRPRFEESARQYAQFQSYPSCVEDVTVRPKYAEYEILKGTPSEINNSIYVALHTNAGGGTGTESYIYNGLGSGRPTITAGSADLRNYIHNQLITDIRTGWNAAWTDRGVKDANFGEVRELNTIPGVLIELAFHDLASDAAELKNPEFRRLAARAFYKGILKFFNNRDGVTLTMLPEQPTHVYAKNNGSNQIQLTWNAPATGGIYGNAATGYKVYISTNGKSFKEGVAVATNNYTFTGNAATIYYFKVSATNAGGESFTSSVVAAKTPMSGVTTVPYLIVDGFNRMDAGLMVPKNESSALGIVKRMILDKMNRYDYMIEHAKALSNCNNIAFDGCENDAVIAGNVLLSNYNAVDWFVGEESSTDKTLDATERSLLKTYMNAGGNLLLSGSEIGWDIGRAASTNVDLDFYNNYLKANYVGDDAGTYDFTGTSTFFTAQNGSFDNGTNNYYDVDFPDRVSANTGGNVFLNYVGGTADAAAIGYSGTYKSIYLAFPIETITNETTRNNLVCNAVAYLTPSLVVPTIGLSFYGNNNKGINTLNWKTISEPNVLYFIVEKSDNAIWFTEVSNKIYAKGNNTNGANYIYTDRQNNTTTYYRLKIVDIDGKHSYSNTIQLSYFSAKPLFTLLQNPTKNAITLHLNTNTEVNIAISDVAGRIMYKQQHINNNNSILKIDCSTFNKGMYFITVQSNNNKQVEKLMIQ